MSDRWRHLRTLLAWPVLLIALAGLLALARRDRAARPHAPLTVDARTLTVAAHVAAADGEGRERPPRPAEMREAAAELERAAQAADEARVGLEKTRQDLEGTKETLDRQRKEFEGLRADADKNSAETRKQLDQARADLEAKREEMEQASRQAEERVAKARRDLEQLQQGRLAAAAQAGIAQDLGRGAGFAMRVTPDPRRARNPAVRPFVPNEAAVAAAGSRGGKTPDRQPGGSPQSLPGGTTVAGDTLRGQAARIEAQGRQAVDTSIAAINAQTARAMTLENHLRTVETFFEARRLNWINRAFEAGPAITSAQAVRMAAAGVPPRPSHAELDPATGTITWPRVLADPAYTHLIGRIQQHFHERLARGGSHDQALAGDFSAACDELEARLRVDVGRHRSGHYGRARSFLETLRREYDLPLTE